MLSNKKHSVFLCISGHFLVQGQQTFLAGLLQHPVVAVHMFLTWRLTMASGSFLHETQFNFSDVYVRFSKVPIMMLEIDSPFLGSNVTEKHQVIKNNLKI